MKKLLKRLNGDGGFSLVEILIAVVILGVSASVVLTGLTSVTSQSSKEGIRQEDTAVLNVAAEAVRSTEFDCNLSLEQNRKLVYLPTGTKIVSIEEMTSNESWVKCSGVASIQRINISYTDPSTGAVTLSSVINTTDGFSALTDNTNHDYIEAVPNQNVEVGTPKVTNLAVIESDESHRNWNFSCANCTSSAFTVSFDNNAKTMTVNASAASAATDVILTASSGNTELATTFIVTTTCPVNSAVGTCATATPKPGQTTSSGENGGKSKKATKSDRDKSTYDRKKGFGYGFGKGYDH
jgi:prepilin-type N-terminal cleavage/methylation domain-containing protein